MMDLFVIKSEHGYARNFEDGSLEWVKMEKASVYPSKEMGEPFLERGQATANQVRLAKLTIKEEDWI